MREMQEGAMAEVIGVRFKEVGKIYYFDPKNNAALKSANAKK